jgi:hypothetical protein
LRQALKETGEPPPLPTAEIQDAVADDGPQKGGAIAFMNGREVLVKQVRMIEDERASKIDLVGPRYVQGLRLGNGKGVVEELVTPGNTPREISVLHVGIPTQ